MNPLSPSQRWRAITIATIVLVPAMWTLPAGLALVPFVFLALAFLSGHPTAPGAVVRAMALTVLVGAVVAVATVDATTGLVAGVGAGGVVAMRADQGHTWQSRAVAVAMVAAYTWVLAHVVGAAVLLSAPILPFTAVGVADHVVERRWQQQRARSADGA
ncbi:MAG TPA: hypothetical protein VEA78_13560 [Acidimicrobiales bacterium]|nr:hypothetical protein [Acidimicrobiales bacterium]